MIRIPGNSHGQLYQPRESELGASQTATATDFAAWVAARKEPLMERWRSDVEARVGGHPEGVAQLLGRFFGLLTDLLPGCLSPYRPQFEPIWRSSAELYGSVAAMRGLAAGEAIEEFQFVREGLIRHLFSDPPPVSRPALLLRDILRINRVVDRGVTYASVGHTDTLFFALFRGSGAPRGLDPERVQELNEQLDAMVAETNTLYTLLGAAWRP